MSAVRNAIACALCLTSLTCVEEPSRLGPAGPVSATSDAPVVLVGAGDIARCDGQGDEATAALLDGIPGTVFTAGNNVYASSTTGPPDFTACYDPSWGRHKARTRPAAGSYEYSSPGAASYWQYFGAAAGDSGRGYYSYDLGSWHVIVLNSKVSMAVGSAQEQWVRADLAAHPALCTLAYWNLARFTSAPTSSGVTVQAAVKPLWDALYQAGAEIVLNGFFQVYERFAPQTPDGAADGPRGIRQFTVGTGGISNNKFLATPLANSQVRSSGTPGVLQLTLSDGGYSWRFIPIAGKTFTDAGSGSCHTSDPATPVASVEVSPASPSLEVGARLRLTAIARDASGAALSERDATWTSSNPAVARVNARGVVTAWQVGSATITATVEGKTGAASVTATPTTAAILVGAGDIASCTGLYDEQTAALLDEIPGTVFTAGDNAYDNGTATEFANCYDPSWGRHKARTRPAPGNHEYGTPGATGYFGYFGAAAGDTARGYYGYDLGAWHVVVLNNYKSMAVGSVQEQWLRADLAAHPSQCTLAIWHHPLFTSGANHGPNISSKPLWQALYDAGAEVVVTGHDHNYQRFAPQTVSGTADAAYGIREFVVGTGGAGMEDFGPPAANLEIRDNGARGVLKLTLRESSYEWQFIPEPGQTFADSGGAPCHGAPGSPPPPPPNTPPQAAFTAACSELTCSFTSTSRDPDGAVVAWSWTFGDGASASVENPSHTYAAAGSYTVGVTVTDDRGATGTTSQTVTVRQPQPPVARPGGPYSADDRVTFDGSGSFDPDNNLPLSYAWTFGDGSAGTGVAPAHAYAADGTYTVTLVVTDATGAASTPETTTATIANVPPTVNAGADATMMAGVYTLRATFSDPGASDAPWSYTIDWGDGLSSRGSTSSQGAITASHPYVVLASYRVRVTVTDKDGGAGTDDLLVTVRLTP